MSLFIGIVWIGRVAKIETAAITSLDNRVQTIGGEVSLDAILCG